MTSLTRRQAITAFLALPLGARVAAQARPGPKHRVILGTINGMLLAPDGTLHMWYRKPGLDVAPSSLGLGHNNAFSSFTLALVPGLTGVVAASLGSNCTFAVFGDGRVLAWGRNPNGWLGTTTQAEMETLASWSPNQSNTPIPQSVRYDAVDVSSGGDHSMALTRDGSVYTWGSGKEGQLGIGPMPVVQFKTRTPAPLGFMPMPVQVPDLGDVKGIAAGGTHSLAVLKDGTVRAWGFNRVGTVGDGTTMNRDRPTVVPGVRDAVAVAAGAALSVALLANGTVMTWGNGGNSDKVQLTPKLVPGVKGVKAIAAGVGHGVALTEAGTVWTWGENAHSQLGRGFNAGEAPGIVKELSGVQSIAAAHETTTAVLSTGRIMTWGEVRQFNRQGKPSIYAYSPIPLSVDGLENS
jgi:alpha-tubulin suppressor-like RCC1 family protein